MQRMETMTQRKQQKSHINRIGQLILSDISYFVASVMFSLICLQFKALLMSETYCTKYAVCISITSA